MAVTEIEKGTRSLPKVVVAPMNFANMPMQIVQALKDRGYEAEQVHYSAGQGHKFGFALDKEVNMREFPDRIGAHIDTLRTYLERDFDLFHFWNKSFFFKPDYSLLTGFDVPLIKARGKKVLFRFTGFDLRLPSWDLERNPYSPYRYGFQSPFREEYQRVFLDFLRDYADCLLVQDPELAQFCPEARIIPRALNLSQWPCVGITKTDRPLVVHAPSKDIVKGTPFVLKAIDQLKSDGLAFEFKLIQNMAHKEAQSWYRKADIIVDQLMIGATGVLTLEAWALGKPVVLNLREDLFQPFYRTSDLPVANANPETVYSVLKKLITDYEWREHLSKSGRRTVEAFHNVDNVVEQFISLYSEVHAAPTTLPRGTHDLDYLAFHARKLEKAANTTSMLDKLLDDVQEKPLDGPRGKQVNLDALPKGETPASAHQQAKRRAREKVRRARPNMQTPVTRKSPATRDFSRLQLLEIALPRYVYMPIKAVALARRRIIRAYKRIKKSRPSTR